MVLSIIEGRLSKTQAARALGFSSKGLGLWTTLFAADCPDGTQDRASR
jgi:hypothetical protein